MRTIDLEDPRWDRTDPDLIAGLSGFEIISVDVTADTYTHLLPEADREAATAMQSLVGTDS